MFVPTYIAFVDCAQMAEQTAMILVLKESFFSVCVCQVIISRISCAFPAPEYWVNDSRPTDSVTLSIFFFIPVPHPKEKNCNLTISKSILRF
jgi:hypothetical protein